MTVFLALSLFMVTMPAVVLAKEGGLRISDEKEAQPQQAAAAVVQEQQPEDLEMSDLDAPIDLSDFLSPEQMLVLDTEEADQSHRDLNGGPFCNVCRDSPHGWRGMTNHGKWFQNNGKWWTCGQVEQSMQDVRVRGPHATAQEKNWCHTIQEIVLANCDCYGAALAPQPVHDPNPGCELCPNNAPVPVKNRQKTVQTGVVGNMNCKGLRHAMMQGVLTANTCSRVANNARAACCY